MQDELWTSTFDMRRRFQRMRAAPAPARQRWRLDWRDARNAPRDAGWRRVANLTDADRLFIANEPAFRMNLRQRLALYKAVRGRTS